MAGPVAPPDPPEAPRGRGLGDLGFAVVGPGPGPGPGPGSGSGSGSPAMTGGWDPPSVEPHPFCDPPAATVHGRAVGAGAGAGRNALPARARSGATARPLVLVRVLAVLAGLAIAAGALGATALVRARDRTDERRDRIETARREADRPPVVGDAGSEAETQAVTVGADPAAPSPGDDDGAVPAGRWGRVTEAGQLVPEGWRISERYADVALPPYPDGCRDGALDDDGTWHCA